MRDPATLIAEAGLPPDTPVALAWVDRGGQIESAVAGKWPNGAPVRPGDSFYLASLAKQVTGAALAVLVRDGTVDPDAPVASWIGDLPDWSRTVTPRHLVHHLGGFPPEGYTEASLGGDWTDGFAMAELRRIASVAPGIAYVYSNLGYILLAHIISAAAGEPLARFAEQRLMVPLGIADMGFATGDVRMQPHAALLGPNLPLSHGDGGLWATAPAYALWLHHQNRDALGIADLVTSPARLADGSLGDYGWGIGLRRHREQPLYLHGGEWTGAVAKAVRSPSLGLGIVALAAGVPLDALDRLVDPVLEAG